MSVALMLALAGMAHGAERVLKVGVIQHSPPMSYLDAGGGLTGFNVEIMRELCRELAARCDTVVLPLERVVDALAAGEGRVAVVKGGIQARHAQARGWQWLPFDNHEAIFAALVAGQADATLLPMASAIALQQDPRAQALGLKSIAVQAPELAGDTALGVNPRDRALLEQLNEALDRIKRDGRFDRINTRFIPFRLQ
jgi:ABC-type amino acid transport substrate-binding protein